jgi:hypothetical protein
MARWLGDAPLRWVDVGSPEEVDPLWASLEIDRDVQHHAIGAAVAPDGSLRFGLRHWEASIWRGNGVFRSDADGTDVEMLAALPPTPVEGWDPNAGELSWSADAEAFLMRYAVTPRRDLTRVGTRLALVGVGDGSALWDASELLGNAEWAAWSD